MSKTISELDSVVSLSTSDLIPVTQGSTGPGTGVTRKATMAEVQGLLPAPTDTSGALVRKAADQNIPNAVSTALVWATAVYDTGTFFNVGSPTRITIPAGISKVKITASALWPSSTGYKTLQVLKNGANFYGKPFEQLAAVPGLTTSRAISALVDVVEGDYFEVYAYQDSGGTVAVKADTATWVLVEVPQGLEGPQGEQGPGVPAGGTPGQILHNSAPGQGEWYATQDLLLQDYVDDLARTVPQLYATTELIVPSLQAGAHPTTAQLGGFFEQAFAVNAGSGANYTLDLSGATAPEDISASYLLEGTGAGNLVVLLPGSGSVLLGQHVAISSNKTWASVSVTSVDGVGNAPSALSAGSSIVFRADGFGSNFWNNIGGSGAAGITSLTVTVPTPFTVTGSPLTSAGTIAIGVSGTSGGLPYFNSTSTMASSALLTSNAVVLGGGAGAAPKTAAGFTTDGTSQLTLGVAGASTGALKLAGATSGLVTVTAQATAGTVTITMPNTSGTPAISVPTPLSLSATTGAVTWSGLTSGGVLYASSTTGVATSALLTANALVLGGGAGAAPTPMGSLGTTTTVLHGNAAGAPTFGAVSLTADVSGTLPVANGGTGITNTPYVDLVFVIQGGGLTIVSGFKYYIFVDFACTVGQWTLGTYDGTGAAVSDTMVIDVYADAYASLGTKTSMVGGGTKPNTSAANRGQAAPSGWTTTSIAVGSWVGVNVTTAPATAVNATLTLRVLRT